MKTKLMMVIAVMAIVALAVPTSSLADEVSDLQAQVKNLTKKLASLEAKVDGSGAGASQNYYMPTEGDEGGLIHTMQDIDMGGYVETRYTSHIDDNSGARPGRVFDGGEGFSVNQIKLWLEKKAPEEGGAGFRVDLLVGNDASVLDPDSASATIPTVSDRGIVSGGTQIGDTEISVADSDDFTFTQAYVEVNAPMPFGDGGLLSEMVNIKAGRMATLAGMEVLEPGDNWNISRSFAFGYGLPFLHTGVRTNFQMFDDALDVYFGVNNGWDNDIDNNDFRSLEWAVGYDITDDISYFTTILFGAETADRTDNHRFLWTHVVTWDVTDALDLAVNIDWGRENDVLETAVSSSNAEWWQLSGYARYQINDKWATAYRIELFRDTDRFRGVTGVNDTLLGNTFTLEYTPYDNFISRLEYRLDTANSGDGSVFGEDSSASTLSAQMIYLI